MPNRPPSSSHPPSVQSELFVQLNEVSHGFFGSAGGVSKGVYESLNVGIGSGDQTEAVVENRRRVARAVGAQSQDQLKSCYQIHSASVVHFTQATPDRPEGDAMVTTVPGLALCILTADCTPVLFADELAGVIGAAHAGWKGAIGGVCEATIAAMQTLGADPDRIVASIGPTIQQASYEVGPEFREHFIGEVPWSGTYFAPGEGDRLQFDLPGFVRTRLEQAGICQIDVIPGDTCTMENQYFSNRRRHHRGEPDYGRNASVIMLTAK